MVPTCSACRAIDRTFFLSFSLSGTTEINNPAVEENKKRYKNPVEIALRMERIVNEGGITKAELARRVGISSERVTQYMNLLKLEPKIKKMILAKGEAIGISERKLRSLIGKNNKISFP